MKRVLITGSNSYLGTHVERYLAEWPEAYQVDTVSLRGDGWKEQSFTDYDVVFHVAGIAHADVGHVSEQCIGEYYRVNTRLAVETAEKAKKDGVKQFIFMSSSIVYGDSAPIGERKLITRNTLATPSGFYGESKLQAEKEIRGLEDTSFKVVILRPPMIYGKGCKGNYPSLSKLARKTPCFPYVENERSLLYVGNFVELVRLLIEDEAEGIFFPQDREYVSTSHFVQAIAAAHGRKLVLVKGFKGILKLLACRSAKIGKAFGSLTYEQNLSEYQSDYRLFSRKQAIALSEGTSDEPG